MPARRADFVTAGVVSTLGAGLFTGLAPAAALAGPWLPASVAAAAVMGCLTILSTSRRSLDTVPPAVRRVVFGMGVLGRLAAAVAVAGTFGRYVTPSRESFGAVALVALVTVVAVVAGRPPVPVVRGAAVVVLGSLALLVAACFAIEPVAPAVAAADGGSPLGVVAGAGLLTVCFLGVAPVPRGGRVVDVHLPEADGGPAGSRPAAGSRPGSGRGVGGARDDSPLEFGVGRGVVRAWRLAVLAVTAVVLVVCLGVGAAALRQLGAARLALSPVPLLDALAAADASALEPLVLAGVAVGTGFVLLGIVRWVLAAAGGRVAGARVGPAIGLVVGVGAVAVDPTVALVGAAVLLMGDGLLRVITIRQ